MKTYEIAASAFSDAIRELGGELPRKDFKRTARYSRATLPVERQILPNDSLKPGVAMRADNATVRVAPYLFRLICSNGAIFGHCGAATSMKLSDSTAPEAIVQFVRTATAAAASEEAIKACFAKLTAGIKARITPRAVLERILFETAEDLELRVMEEALAAASRDSGIRTRYDAMNAITAAAREVEDPELQWEMEAFATTFLTDLTPAERAFTFADKFAAGRSDLRSANASSSVGRAGDETYAGAASDLETAPSQRF